MAPLLWEEKGGSYLTNQFWHTHFKHCGFHLMLVSSNTSPVVYSSDIKAIAFFLNVVQKKSSICKTVKYEQRPHVSSFWLVNESSYLQKLCFWCPEAGDTLLPNSTLLSRCGKGESTAHLIKIKRLLETQQNFNNERLYLQIQQPAPNQGECTSEPAN